MPEKAKSKWLLGGILKHHCPLCATPLASEKGRRCLGEHVEWCPKYHGLCRVGHKDRCPACHNIAEQHEKRHRQIAELWHQVKRAQHAPAGSPIAGPQPDTSPTEEEDDATPPVPSPQSSPSPRKREQKAAKKASNAQNRDRTAVSSAELAAVAKALHPDVDVDDEEIGPDTPRSPDDPGLTMEVNRVLSLLLLPLSNRETPIDTSLRPAVSSASEIDSAETKTLLATLANVIREDLHCSREERMRAVRAEADFRAWATAKAFVRKAEREGRRSSGESRYSGDDGKEDGGEENGEGDGYEGDGEGLQEGTLEAYEMAGKGGNGEEGVKGERTGILGEETKKVVEGKVKRAPTVSKSLAAGRLILCSNGGLHHLRKKLSER